jgi:zinc-binding alcohol dehydrogenase family protein
MKAVGYQGTQKGFVDLTVERPVPQGHDLLVRVKAISVNPIDTKVRARNPEPAEPLILGWDASGIVEAVGASCTLFQPGDEVYYAGDVTRSGSNQEYQLIDERIVGRKPRSLSFAEAAAMPLTTVTAWESLFDRLGIVRGNQAHLLIIGGAGGVGSIAIQLAKWAGLTVIATASRSESKEWCLKLGADAVIDHRQPLKGQLEELGISGVPYLYCTQSTAAYWEQMVDVTLPQGKICAIVDAQKALPIDLLKDKSLTFAWELMFTRSKYQTADMIRQHEILTEASSLFDQGVLRTTLTESWTPVNAAKIEQAHARLETGKMIGKLVLTFE